MSFYAEALAGKDFDFKKISFDQVFLMFLALNFYNKITTAYLLPNLLLNSIHPDWKFVCRY